MKDISESNIEKKIYKLLGIIGFCMLAFFLLMPIMSEKEFIIKSSYDENIRVMGIYKSYAGFILDLFAFLFVPIFCIYLGFKEYLFMKILAVLLFIGIIIYTISLFN